LFLQTFSPTLRVSLLDGFRLWRDREAIGLPLSAQRLLAFVALHENPIPRLQVAGTLWPDSPERQSSGCLRSALWRLRPLASLLVRSNKQQLQLQEGVSVDFREANQAARRLIAEPVNPETAGLPLLENAAGLLEGWYDDWVLLERERFRQLRLRALEAVCKRLTETGRYAQAVRAGLAAVVSEPLRETARRVLIEACIAEGNYAEAIHQYHSYSRVLQDELGLQPSPLIRQLIAAIGNRQAAIEV
jgi:DNA-binding SARP family transcriptional activator